jgi:hypothetical protein
LAALATLSPFKAVVNVFGPGGGLEVGDVAAVVEQTRKVRNRNRIW